MYKTIKSVDRIKLDNDPDTLSIHPQSKFRTLIFVDNIILFVFSFSVRYHITTINLHIYGRVRKLVEPCVW